jgi:membrane protein DedA with SNARE-associated domain
MKPSYQIIAVVLLAIAICFCGCSAKYTYGKSYYQNNPVCVLRHR